MPSVKTYRNYCFESSTIRTMEYIMFERQCKKELVAQCRKFGINVHKFLGNHFEWSAVLEKNGKYIYVSISDVRYWKWYDEVLIRTMAHDSDWRGGSNNYCTFDKIAEKADRLLQ